MAVMGHGAVLKRDYKSRFCIRELMFLGGDLVAELRPSLYMYLLREYSSWTKHRVLGFLRPSVQDQFFVLTYCAYNNPISSLFKLLWYIKIANPQKVFNSLRCRNWQINPKI